MKILSGWSRATVMSLSLALLPLTMIGTPAFAGQRAVIVETRELYVSVVPQDSAGHIPVPPNSHPAEMTEELLVTLLDSVQVRDTLKAKPTPLFTEGALQLLAPHLQQALRKAGPREDVTFIVVALYKTLLGGNTPKTTSGRLFYLDGKLNLIFGVVKDEGRSRLDAQDRDYRLIAVGSRQETAAGDWSLVTGEDRPFELPRKDWVVVDPKAARVVKPAVAATPAATPYMKKGPTDRPLSQRLATLIELKEKGLITEEEYKAKRREIMNEKEPERTPSERLATLNELKKQGVITDEEYRAKRLQILGDL